MELRQLVTFKTIVDSGGFKKAAEKLGYAQSSITSHVKELETELETALFDRLGKTVTLTQSGKRFFPYAVDIIQLYNQAKEAVQEDGEPSGKLTIGVSESLMIYWLPEFIRSFMAKYPAVHLELKAVDYQNVTAQLKRGDYDMALLVEMSGWQSDELIVQKLSEEPLLLVRSSEADEPPASETMLLAERSCSWRPVFEEYLQKSGKDSGETIELPSIEAIKQCVLSGLGTSLLPHFSVQSDIESGRLKHIEVDLSNEHAGIYTAYHKNKWRSSCFNVFCQELEQSLPK